MFGFYKTPTTKIPMVGSDNFRDLLYMSYDCALVADAISQGTEVRSSQRMALIR